MGVFRDCVICKGDRHRPRNGKGGNTCSASQCKKSYQAQREMQQKLGGNELPSVASFNELLPENKTVRELIRFSVSAAASFSTDASGLVSTIVFSGWVVPT